MNSKNKRIISMQEYNEKNLANAASVVLEQIRSIAEKEKITLPRGENYDLKFYIAYLLSEIEVKKADELFNKQKEVLKHTSIMTFRFQNLDDVHNIASLISNACPNPEKVMLGITEMMINAVEHGNLGITYEEKTALVQSGQWLNEVERRLGLPENKDKYAYVTFDRRKEEILISVKDCGDGFDWNKYLTVDENRATHVHGRGIAMAKLISFDKIEYLDKGNGVVCTVKLENS